MFDLEKAISGWRRQMQAAGIQTPVPLEELENHLREDIEQQAKSGLSEQEAFEMAVGKIGQANPLKEEFQKINRQDKARRQRRVGGIFFAGILVFYSSMMTYAMSKNDLSGNERLSGFASLATMLALVFAVWQILPRFFPMLAGKTVPSAIGLIGGISGAGWFLVFAYFILPRFDFTQGQLLVAVLWAMVPAMVLPTTAFLVLDKSENQHQLAGA